MRRVLGGVLLLVGVAQAGWIAYNLFIQRLPGTQGIDPLPAIGVAGALIYVGAYWLRGKTAPNPGERR